MLAHQANEQFRLAANQEREAPNKEDEKEREATNNEAETSHKERPKKLFSPPPPPAWYRLITHNWSHEKEEYKEAEPVYLVEPIVLVGDLDMDIHGRIGASEYKAILDSREKKLKVLDFSDVHLGGAGNVPLIGQYLARVVLNGKPSSFQTYPEWELYHSYLIDSAGFKENEARLFFYIFAAGGGTGSGMSGEFGLAQQYSYHSRIHDESPEVNASGSEIDDNPSEANGGGSETSDRSTEANAGRSRTESRVSRSEPIFSAGIAILPDLDPESAEYSQATHINAGRLICKYFSEEWRFSNGNLEQDSKSGFDRILRPWNALVLVSNNIMRFVEESEEEVGRTKIEKDTNKYVAQQILNILTGQALTIDYDESFIREAGINIGDTMRVDVNDLYMSLVGPVAVAYAESAVPASGNALDIRDVFFRSISFPRLNMQTQAIEGISVLPQASKIYKETLDKFKEQFADNGSYQALEGVKCFINCPATITVISVPLGFELRSKTLSELKLAQDKVFPHTKLKRYALIVASSPYLSLTTLIARSACLSDEVLTLLFAYIKRCFARDPHKYANDGRIEEALMRYMTRLVQDKGIIKGMLEESEDVSEIMLANWKEVKSTYERKARDMFPDSDRFVNMDDILLKADDVINALDYIAVTLRHQGVPLSRTDVTSWKVEREFKTPRSEASA
jgi:hypothetical protein